MSSFGDLTQFNNSNGNGYGLLTSEIWSNAINTLLTALENIFLDENGMPLRPRDSDASMDSVLRSRRLSISNQMAEEMPYITLTPLKRKQSMEEDERIVKSQRCSLDLSSQLARVLRISDNSCEVANDESSKTDIPMSTSSSFITHRPVKSYPRLIHKYRRSSNVSTEIIDVEMIDSAIEPIDDHDQVTERPENIPERIKMYHKIVSHVNEGIWASSLSFNMSNWFEIQARKRGMTTEQFDKEFHERVLELKSALSLLQQRIPHDYHEILAVIDRFLINADWLRNDYSVTFMQMFPKWYGMARNMEDIVQYVEIVEDMKASTKLEFPQTEDLKSDLEKAQEIMHTKKYLYGDVLLESGLRWRVRGYPAQDSLIDRTKRWLFDWNSRFSSIIHINLNKYNESAVDDPRLVQLMTNIMLFLKISKQTVELTGMLNDKLSLSSIYLATHYVHWALSQIDKLEHKVVRSFEVKIMHICENINLILHYLRIIQNTDMDKPIPHNHVKVIEDFIAVMVEAGLRLCEHVIKPNTNLTIGAENFGYIYSEFVMKFVNKLIEYAGYEQKAEARMRVLINTLRNMGSSLSSI
ncbi:2104_t:CDS:2 [Ambispora gerdemannii]|uniref:2104_t:CDS:1 n=1 Tax=Ambispora gerdemannii TaxID=144530 RepID=A0A9N9FY61_9GLOM|nr:2104_t:CDS:2 [Ambispora gerdemannii]